MQSLCEEKYIYHDSFPEKMQVTPLAAFADLEEEDQIIAFVYTVSYCVKSLKPLNIKIWWYSQHIFLSIYAE